MMNLYEMTLHLQCRSLLGFTFSLPLQDLAQLTNLAHLNLSCCRSLTEATLESIGTLPSLTSLNVQLCENMLCSDEAGQALSGLTRLNDLDVSGCNCLGDTTLGAIFQLTQLTRLDLSSSNKATDTTLAGITALGRLVCLSLVQCDAVTDVSLPAIASLTGLESLSLMSCREPSDEVLGWVLGRLTNMISLVLSGCMGVGAATAASFDALPLLFYLELRFCPGLDPETLVGLLRRRNRPALRRAAADAIWIVSKSGNYAPGAFHSAVPLLVELSCLSPLGPLRDAAEKALGSLSEGNAQVYEAIEDAKYALGF